MRRHVDAPLVGVRLVVGDLLLEDGLVEHRVGDTVLLVYGRRLRDLVLHAEHEALVHEPVAILVDPEERASEAELRPQRAEHLHLMADAVVLQVAHAGELGCARRQHHVHAIAEVAGRADALERLQVEAVLLQALVALANPPVASTTNLASYCTRSPNASMAYTPFTLPDSS